MLNDLMLLKAKRKKLTINITPLIDVLFILLIFFMISSTFLEQPAIKLELPKAKTAEVSQAKDVVIVLTKEGGVYMNDLKIDEKTLRENLKAVAEKDKDTSIVFKADQGATYGDVIGVIDIIRESGLKKIAALTRTSSDTSK